MCVWYGVGIGSHNDNDSLFFFTLFYFVQTVYQLSPFPWSELTELREKYTYDIHPFTTFRTEKKRAKLKAQKLQQQKPRKFFLIRES